MFTWIKKTIIIAVFYSAACHTSLAQSSRHPIIQIAFTSDVHYGYYRKTFRGQDSVPGDVVNKAMLNSIQTLPSLTLPDDNGVGTGAPVGYIDYLAITGDLANRQEIPFQSAASSWQQFTGNYVNNLHTHNSSGGKTELLLTAGNHDMSNAIGYYKPMFPVKDASSMAGIYNLVMHPAQSKTAASFDYTQDKINYSRDINGIHLVFIELWPDSVNCAWLEKDLQQISASTPVLLFTHVQPQGDAKHFTNPYAPHNINAKDRFENLMPEMLKDTTLRNGKPQDRAEEKLFAAFLHKHPNIKAYFHGHENANEFYTYTGPEGDLALPVFRVDSPLKGQVSSKDETKLSFQLISIDTDNLVLTVRECLWNTAGVQSADIVWGQSKTIRLN